MPSMQICMDTNVANDCLIIIMNFSFRSNVMVYTMSGRVRKIELLLNGLESKSSKSVAVSIQICMEDISTVYYLLSVNHSRDIGKQTNSTVNNIIQCIVINTK